MYPCQKCGTEIFDQGFCEKCFQKLDEEIDAWLATPKKATAEMQAPLLPSQIDLRLKCLERVVALLAERCGIPWETVERVLKGEGE